MSRWQSHRDKKIASEEEKERRGMWQLQTVCLVASLDHKKNMFASSCDVPACTVRGSFYLTLKYQVKKNKN